MTVVYTKSQVDSMATKIGKRIKEVDSKVSGKIPLSEKASALGVATLGSDGIVPNTQLPRYGTAANRDIGEDFGNVPLSESVLHIANSTRPKILPDVSLNCDYFESGSYYILDPTCLNAPPFSYAQIFTIQGWSDSRIQVAFGYLDTQMYIRNKQYNSEYWSPWKNLSGVSREELRQLDVESLKVGSESPRIAYKKIQTTFYSDTDIPHDLPYGTNILSVTGSINELGQDNHLTSGTPTNGYQWGINWGAESLKLTATGSDYDGYPVTILITFEVS